MNSWGHLTPGKTRCSACSPAVYFLLCCSPDSHAADTRRAGANRCKRTQWVGRSCQLTSSQPGCSPLGTAFEKQVNSGLPSPPPLKIASVQTLPPCGVVAWLQITGLNFAFILPFTNTTLTAEAGLPENILGTTVPCLSGPDYLPFGSRMLRNAWHRDSLDLGLAFWKLPPWLEKFYIQSLQLCHLCTTSF